MADAPLGAVLRHVRRLAAQDADGPSDGALLRAFAAGEGQAAFTTLVKRHRALVLGVCRHVLHDLHDAEDAFQAAFILLARNAAAVSRQDPLAGWLHAVAYRTARDVRRAAARRRRYEGRARTMRVASPEWEVMWREVQAVLDEEVQRLPGVYREAFILCCLENKSAAEATPAWPKPSRALTGPCTGHPSTTWRRPPGRSAAWSATATPASRWPACP
jgi:RNA polymerase sigma factor (sigma-70 family)